MLILRSEFVARIKQRSPNAIRTNCVFQREALASRTLPATMNGKLAIAIRVDNFVKASSVKSMLFTALCKDMEADHENLVSHGCLMVSNRQHAS